MEKTYGPQAQERQDVSAALDRLDKSKRTGGRDSTALN
jgi:hypothetical protein